MKLEEIKNQVIWTTQKGERLRLEDMHTVHVFNSLKMQYNHLAVVYGGMETVWFTKQYEDKIAEAKLQPELMILTVFLFISEIEKRGDLEEKFIEPYELIKTEFLKKFNDYVKSKIESG